MSRLNSIFRLSILGGALIIGGGGGPPGPPPLDIMFVSCPYSSSLFFSFNYLEGVVGHHQEEEGEGGLRGRVLEEEEEVARPLKEEVEVAVLLSLLLHFSFLRRREKEPFLQLLFFSFLLEQGNSPIFGHFLSVEQFGLSLLCLLF